jgi:hypothetical protein
MSVPVSNEHPFRDRFNKVGHNQEVSREAHGAMVVKSSKFNRLQFGLDFLQRFFAPSVKPQVLQGIPIFNVVSQPWNAGGTGKCG